MKKIILASSSVSRKEVMKKLISDFEIIHPDIDERKLHHKDPWKTIELIAFGKAVSVYTKIKKGIIIAADTMVLCERQLIGKTNDFNKAFQTLKFLQNKTFTTITAMCCIDVENNLNLYRKNSYTNISLHAMTDQEIISYIHTNEPYNKAGALAPEALGAKYVKAVSGDFFSMLGLSAFELYQYFKKIGFYDDEKN